MKFTTIAVLLFIQLAVQAQTNASPPPADSLLNVAFQKLEGTNKQVLVIFGASWCGWCRKMDASLQDAAIKPLFDKNFEIVHLSVYESSTKKHLENKGALAFLTSLGGADKGLPYWYVLDKNRKVLADSQYEPGKNTGCPASAEEVGYFLRVLQKTSPLTAAELEVVRQRFRQNEN